MMSAIVDHLWQSTLFVVVAWLLTLALRNNAARVRYWVWFAASIKFLVPFSLLTTFGNQFSWREAASIPVGETFLNTVQQVVEPLATPEVVLRVPQAQAFDYMPILISIWVAGGVLLLLRWSVSWWRVAAAVRKAQPVAIQAPIAVKSTSVMSEPGVVGVLRPVLLLPEGIASRLTPAQLQAVLAHELCHVRRRDNLTAAIHMIVEVLFWFHPMVWWIGAKLVEERELACDQGVVERGNEPQTYAEGILKVCQFYMESKLTCVAGVSGANLKKRVEVIMRGCIATQLGVIKKSMLTVAGCAAVAGPIVIGMNTIVPQDSQAQAPQNLQYYFKDVSVKPTTGDDRNLVSFFMMQGKLAAKNRPLKPLVAMAYGVTESQVVGGPNWVATAPFDIEAVANEKPPSDGPTGMVWYRPMVLRLLTEQFNLNAHRETVMRQAYVLRVADGGAKLESVEPSIELIGQGRIVHAGDEVIGILTPLSHFVHFLSQQLGATVVNHTELKGIYNFKLKGKVSKDTLAAALNDQLGLKLESQSSPVEVVVIDYARQPDLSVQRSAASAANAPTLMEIAPADQVSFESFRRDSDFRMPDQSIRDLIVKAYNLQPYQVIGLPDWVDTQKFHVAFADGLLDQEEATGIPRAIVIQQAFLAERFGLTFHRENRTMPVYVLSVSPQGVNSAGLRSHEEETGERPGVVSVNRDGVFSFPKRALRVSMESIASFASNALKSVVIDRTGLRAKYSFDLQSDPTDAALPSILRSELGLTLEPRRESVQMFVVDSIQLPAVGATTRSAAR